MKKVHALSSRGPFTATPRFIYSHHERSEVISSFGLGTPLQRQLGPENAVALDSRAFSITDSHIRPSVLAQNLCAGPNISISGNWILRTPAAPECENTMKKSIRNQIHFGDHPDGWIPEKHHRHTRKPALRPEPPWKKVFDFSRGLSIGIPGHNRSVYPMFHVKHNLHERFTADAQIICLQHGFHLRAVD